MINQNEIARMLGISRSTAAVHISSLQKQGYLSGRGYILNEDSYVVGIGACNIDIYGTSAIKIRTHYDHPAHIRSSVGGVMHNIIINLARLGEKTKLITAYGDDPEGDLILRKCLADNVDLSDSLRVKEASSGIFMQVQDENNDMYLALCDMSVLDHLTPEYILEKKKTILGSRMVIIDPSLRLDTIETIIDICKDQVPICVDPISDNYAIKIRPYAASFEMIKANRSEFENLVQKKIKKHEDIEKEGRKLLEKGLKKLVVSLGKDGILYMDDERVISRKFHETKMVNASGAGDALMAAMVYGQINSLDIDETINLGLAAGKAAIRSAETINAQMSIDLLHKIIEEENNEF